MNDAEWADVRREFAEAKTKISWIIFVLWGMSPGWVFEGWFVPLDVISEKGLGFFMHLLEAEEGIVEGGEQLLFYGLSGVLLAAMLAASSSEINFYDSPQISYAYFAIFAGLVGFIPLWAGSLLSSNLTLAYRPWNDYEYGDVWFWVWESWEAGMEWDALLFVDSLSYILLFLTVLLLPVILMVVFSVRSGQEVLILNTALITYLTAYAFTVSNLFMFYVVFEIILLPMFFVIGLWGSRSERSLAAYMFFLYTLAGSVFFLFALVLISYFIGRFGFEHLYLGMMNDVDPSIRTIIWGCLFAAFAFKVPLFPVHSWLTVAHVEAPTVGSIILASLLLKLGGYGLARFVVGLFPDCSFMYQDFLISLCLLGGLFSAICAFRQLDLKRFVAYTSISHMHFLVLSLFSLTEVGYWGMVHGMVSHGLVAAGLFALIGCVYDRFGARMTLYFSGLLGQLPVFSMLWCMFLFANAGLPFLSGFPSEVCAMLALFLTNSGIGFFSIGAFMFGAVYAFLMQARILFGSPNWWLASRSVATDLLRHEVVLLTYLWVWVVILGIKPEVILTPLKSLTY